jgi:DNA-binding transcriptional LysR family regulator
MQYETRTTDAICRLVARGLGVSVVGSSAEYLRTISDCVALPFAAPLSFRAVLFWSKNKPMSAVGETFLDIARAGISR